MRGAFGDPFFGVVMDDDVCFAGERGFPPASWSETRIDMIGKVVTISRRQQPLTRNTFFSCVFSGFAQACWRDSEGHRAGLSVPSLCSI